MKKIYFVRHGQSEGNIVSAIQQTAETPLTGFGRTQAMAIAERAMRFPVDVIISSTHSRAKETARIISEKINKNISLSDLFVERRRPSVQFGRSKDDPMVIEVDRLMKENYSVPGYRYSDEENFDDLKERSGKALDFLAKRPEDHILVTTHGYFMRIIISRATFGNDLTNREYEKFVNTFRMDNTGITVFGYDDKRENPWHVLVWNDHAHLAELEGMV